MADKSALLAGREERDLVTQGKSILEDQRDLLAQKMLAMIKDLESLQENFTRSLEQARRSVRLAVMRHGKNGVTAYAAPASTLPEPQWQSRNLSGALLLGAVDVTYTDPPNPGSGWDVSVELDAAVLAFHKLIHAGVWMAALENDLERLIAVFTRCQRRVNALENVVLPELHGRIRRIEEALEDADREAVVRARLARGRASARY